MKYLIFALVILAACAPIVDSPQLRNSIETKTVLTVIAVPPLPGRIRITLYMPTPTPLPDWDYVVTPTVTP